MGCVPADKLAVDPRGLCLASQAPTLIASPLAGVRIARFDRRLLLLVTQWLSRLESLIANAGMDQFIWNVICSHEAV